MFSTMFCHIFIIIVEGASVYSSFNESVVNDIIVMNLKAQVFSYNESTPHKRSKSQENYASLVERNGIPQLKHDRQRRHSITGSCFGLCKRSFCPWTKAWDIDNTRVPASIPKAICSRKCHFNFTSSVSSKILDVFTTCEPLKIDYPIFKDNKYTYIKDWPVACVCTKKVISEVPHLQIKGNHAKKRKNIKENDHIFKRRRQRRHREKSQRSRNKLRHYRNFKIVPPVLRPFLFLPQYKK